MGVKVRLGTLAVDMDSQSVTVQGPNGPETIRTRTRIWAAGVQASPLARITLCTWARALWFSHNRAHRIITFGRVRTPAALARAVRHTPIEPAAPASPESPAVSPSTPTDRTG